MNNITVTVNGTRKTAPAGSLLSDILHGEKPCGGHGKCGKCRVIARGQLSPLTDAERRILSVDEIDSGVRFACLTYATGDCEIESCSQAASARIVTEGALPIVSLDPLFSRYGVAIDIGTTTLAARLYDTQGTLLSEASDLNPQAKWGADVVSRIEAALDGKDEALARSIRKALTDTLSVLAHKANIRAEEIDGVVITGNTVMLSLLTEDSVEPFSHAPFAVSRFFGETITADDLTLTCLAPATPVYLPPCISAFVGADITCAMLATQLCEGNTALLADIGTNGEMALWHDGKLTVCSTAAGPAFEGVGISMGMRGADGAIDKVTLSEGTLQAHILGNGCRIRQADIEGLGPGVTACNRSSIKFKLCGECKRCYTVSTHCIIQSISINMNLIYIIPEILRISAITAGYGHKRRTGVIKGVVISALKPGSILVNSFTVIGIGILTVRTGKAQVYGVCEITNGCDFSCGGSKRTGIGFAVVQIDQLVTFRGAFFSKSNA